MSASTAKDHHRWWKEAVIYQVCGFVCLLPDSLNLYGEEHPLADLRHERPGLRLSVTAMEMAGVTFLVSRPSSTTSERLV